MKYNVEIFTDGKGSVLKIQGILSRKTWIGGNSESGDKPRSHTWFKGQGRVTYASGKELFFNFETRKQDDVENTESMNLRKEFMRLSGLGDKAQIPDEKPILLYFIENVRSAVLEGEKKTDALPVVTITPPVLDGESFVKLGLIIEPGRQMEFAV